MIRRFLENVLALIGLIALIASVPFVMSLTPVEEAPKTISAAKLAERKINEAIARERQYQKSRRKEIP